MGSAAVVGSSYGGRVAMELATAHPARVSSLVLLCSAYRGLEPSAEDAPALEAFGGEEERLLEAGDVDGAVELNVRHLGGAGGGPELRELVGDDAAARLRGAAGGRRAGPAALDRAASRSTRRRSRCDTLVVSGAHDLGHFRAIAAHLGEQIPGAELVELDWAGHLPSMERPDAVLALLLDVLRDDPTVHAP